MLHQWTHLQHLLAWTCRQCHLWMLHQWTHLQHHQKWLQWTSCHPDQMHQQLKNRLTTQHLCLVAPHFLVALHYLILPRKAKKSKSLLNLQNYLLHLNQIQSLESQIILSENRLERLSAAVRKLTKSLAINLKEPFTKLKNRLSPQMVKLLSNP